MHVFARPGIKRLSDPAGKLVSMDNRGSKTATTATLLFSRSCIAVQPVYDPTVDAMEKLRRGDISPMVRVTGKPARFTTPLREGTRLLAVPLPKGLLETYLPGSFPSADYPALVMAGETVETVAVVAVLAAYNHRGADCREHLVRFSQALSWRFDSFMRPPRHLKWRDVPLTATAPGWTKFGSLTPPPQSQQPRRYRRAREATKG